MLKKLFTTAVCGVGLFTGSSLQADFLTPAHCKADIGPLYVNVKVLQNNHTIESLDMGGGRFDATILPFECSGFCLKPFVFAAAGNHSSSLVSGGCAVGYYVPLNDTWSVLPYVGYSGFGLRTFVNLPSPVPGVALKHEKERFRSTSPYVGLEACFKITPNLNLTGIYQYAWARTHTTIGDVVNEKGHSQGSSVAAVLEYFFADRWSVTAAAAYNESLSREKHGLRALGGKLGLGYTY